MRLWRPEKHTLSMRVGCTRGPLLQLLKALPEEYGPTYRRHSLRLAFPGRSSATTPPLLPHLVDHGAHVRVLVQQHLRGSNSGESLARHGRSTRSKPPPLCHERTHVAHAPLPRPPSSAAGSTPQSPPTHTWPMRYLKGSCSSLRFRWMMWPTVSKEEGASTPAGSSFCGWWGARRVQYDVGGCTGLAGGTSRSAPLGHQPTKHRCPLLARLDVQYGLHWHLPHLCFAACCHTP